MPYFITCADWSAGMRVVRSGCMVTLVGNVLLGLVVVAAVGYGIRSNLYRLRWEKPASDVPGPG
jgi:hypothetical protein